ncbi:hypothetical protein BRD00_04210 [Halobacteriales archaeon QS_8_69_26]|nr:MAG: hypothetical protein BRD00_04210 [Halobacteriales archaeon QS_8_69_26]
MLEPLTVGLVAAALADGETAAAAAEDYRDRPGYPAPVAGLATTFWNALEGELRTTVDGPGTVPEDGATPGDAGGSERGGSPEADGGEAADPSSATPVDWGAIPAELSAVDPVLRDELDGVERIRDALAGVEGVDATDPDRERELGAAVVAAYRETVAGAGMLAGTDLAGRIGLDDREEFEAAVGEATRRLGRLVEGFRRRGALDVVDADGDVDRRIRRHLAARDPPFVDRPELSGLPPSPTHDREAVRDRSSRALDDSAADAPTPDRGSAPDGRPAVEPILVRGGPGAGKSRAVAELAARLLDRESVEGVLFPTGILRHPADVAAPGSLEGDLALVWDDAHAAPGTDGTVVREVVRTLSSALAEEGHRLWVVLSADAGTVDALPGALGGHGDADATADPSAPAPEGDPPGDRFGAGARTVDLGRADGEALAAVARAAMDRKGVAAADGAVAALVDRAEDGDPTPLSVESAVAVGADDGGLSEADVADLPDDTHALWRTAYERLGDGDDRTPPQRVLEAVALLAATDHPSPHRSRLVEGVYEHVLGGHPDGFRDAVRTLIEQEWIEVLDAGEASVSGGDEGSIPPDDEDLGTGTDGSDVESLDWHREGAVGLGIEYRVHRAKLEAVPLDVDRHLSALSSFFLAHLDRYLRPPDPRLDRLLPPTDPRLERAHQDRLATVLAAEGREDLAERHFERLVEGVDADGPLPRFGYTLLLTGREAGSAVAGDSGNPAAEFAEAHREYAARLLGAGDHTAAAVHFERALAIDPDHADANHGYANLLARAGDEAAADHYERALDAAPGDARIHRDYGDFLAGRDDAAAAAHYERAVELDPGDADAHYDLGTLRYGQGDPDAAARHYERAVEADPDHPRARYNLALVRRADDPGAALEHLDRAVESWLDRDRPDNAVENLATRIEVLLDQGRVGAAREACERGRDLVARNDLSPDDYAVRWIGSEALRLDAVADPPTDAAGDPDLPALYESALLHQVAGDDRRALHLLATLWDARSTVRPDGQDPAASGDDASEEAAEPDATAADPAEAVADAENAAEEGGSLAGDAAEDDGSLAGSDPPDPEADPHEAALAAGVALAGHLRAMARPDVDRPDGILARIEVGTDVDLDSGAIVDAVGPHRGVLSTPVRAVYDRLATGGADVSPADLRDLAAGELPDDLGRPTLEPHVYATLLGSLTGDETG